jgi:hypothetical protein
MVIIVQVIIPTDLSEKQQRLARELDDSLEPRNLRARGGGGEGLFSRMRHSFFG